MSEGMDGLNMLIKYSYDPLDRLVSYASEESPPVQRFYCEKRLATEAEGVIFHCFIRGDNQLVAQQRRVDKVVDAALLVTDLSGSVCQVKSAAQQHSIVYTPYGHRPIENIQISLLGFNGERCDPLTGHYLLGNGYRAFNPILMRFNSPDSMSPFDEGGINTYAFNSGDPLNWVDPSGHIPVRVNFKLSKPVMGRVLNGRVIKKGVARRAGSDFSKVRSHVSGESLLTASEKRFVEIVKQVEAGEAPITVRLQGVEMGAMDRAGEFLKNKRSGPGRRDWVFKKIKAEKFDPPELPYQLAEAQHMADQKTWNEYLRGAQGFSDSSSTVFRTRLFNNERSREAFNLWLQQTN